MKFLRDGDYWKARRLSALIYLWFISMKYIFPSPFELPFSFYFIFMLVSINVKWIEKLSLRRHQKRAMWNVCLWTFFFTLSVLEATNNDWTLLCNAVNSISTIFYFLMWLQFQNRFVKNSIVTCESVRHVEIDGWWWPYAKLFLVYSIFLLSHIKIEFSFLFSRRRVYWKSFLMKNFQFIIFLKSLRMDVELLSKYCRKVFHGFIKSTWRRQFFLVKDQKNFVG